jgi:hypothetical protein
MKQTPTKQHDTSCRATDIGYAVMVAAYWFGYAFAN